MFLHPLITLPAYGIMLAAMLLLAVVGEETYAVASGTGAERILGRDARDTLLSRHFRPAFQARDYDAAVADFLLGTAHAHRFVGNYHDESAQLWSRDGRLLVTANQLMYFKA